MTSAVNQDALLAKGSQIRIFIQPDGIGPGNPYYYNGCLTLAGPSQDLGEPEPVYCPSSEQRNKWDIVDSIPKSPAPGTTDFTQRSSATLADVWWGLKRRGCYFNMKSIFSNCARPDDPNQWDAQILYRRNKLTNLATGAHNPLSGDDNAPLDLTGSLSFEEFDTILPVLFGEKADAILVAEALDGLWYDIIQCGDCGVPSDGCNKGYVLTAANAGSPGLSSQVLYTADGGSTFAAMDIPPLGGLSGNRIAGMGNYLVVVSEAGGGHYYALQSDVDAGTIAWTKVSSGYVAGKMPRAIFVKSSTQAFVAGAGGYIYYMTDPTLPVTVVADGSATTQGLNDIAGFGRTLMAVGNSNAVLLSTNDGQTFSLITGPAIGVNLTAVAAVLSQLWFVGGGGRLFYTLDQGTHWTEIFFAAGATAINDIRFVNDTIGYMAVEIGGVGRVYRTVDSGRTWQFDRPSLRGLPTNQRINFTAPCGWNTVMAGGRKTVGGDGMLAIGEAAR